MTIKSISKLVILCILIVAVVGDLKITKEDKLSKEEISKRMNEYIKSIGKDFVDKASNCKQRNQSISTLFNQLQEKFSHYPFQVKSINDSISNWYNNPEVHHPLFIKTVDPTGYNQEALTELITDFFVDEYFISVADLPINLLENVGPLTKTSYLKEITAKYANLCPNFQIFILNKLPLTSSLPSIMKTLDLPKTAIFIFHYTLPLDKYKSITSNSQSIKSSDMLIFHPLTPNRNLEYLKQQWKDMSDYRPRFFDQNINIYLDKSFFEFLVSPESHIIEYKSIVFLNKDTNSDGTFYYSKDASYLLHTIISLCNCLVEHYVPSTSYYLSLSVYVQNEAVYATLRQIYYEYFILYYSKTYTHDRPFEKLVQEEVKFGKIECNNIVSYLSIFSSSVFSLSLEVVSALCAEIILVVIFIKCLLHSWKKDEEKEVEKKGDFKKLAHLRRYSGRILYPKSPHAKAPKVRSLSPKLQIGVTPINPKSKMTRRRKSSSISSRPSIQSSEMSDSRSLDLDE